MYKFIFFDLDDTLLDHKKAEKLGLEQIWNEFRLNRFSDLDSFQQTYHHINVILWEMYGRGEIDRLTLQKTRFERTLYRIGSDLDPIIVGNLYMKFYQQFWTWINDAKLAFDLIKKQYRVGILTNGFADTQRLKLKQFGLATPDILTLISEEIGIMKPQPGIFQRATELSGVSKENILYVGDSYSSDLLGGTSFGWDVAWFSNETDPEKTKLAKLTFQHFNQLLSFLGI